MKTTPKALKDLYVALGGEAADVADMSTSVEVLNAISAKYSGASDAIVNPDAIDAIAAVAGNIGGGGDSDFSTAEVTVGAGVAFFSPVVINEEEFQGIVMINDPMEEQMIWQVPLYKGKCMVNIYTSEEGQTISVSGNITEIDTNIYHITGDCSISITQATPED